MKYKELAPIKETTEDFEKTERELMRIWKKYLYEPLMKELFIKPSTIQNAADDELISAILSGRLTFSRGKFSGDISAKTSKQLKSLGAVWDRTQGAWKIPKSALPTEVVQAIESSHARFLEKITDLDRKLAKIVPVEIAEKVQVSKYFDAALWKVQKDFVSSVKNITVAPKLTEEQSKKIADEWQNNMKLWVNDFTEKEIKKMRTQVQEKILSGGRYESLVQVIKDSYGVTENKAKFLARQETGLLMSQFKQGRYEEAGVEEYIWKCVAGSPKHPVRPMHKALDGKIFKWSNPPITDEKGNRNSPGQDFNCRCYAKPIVRI